MMKNEGTSGILHLLWWFLSMTDSMERYGEAAFIVPQWY